MDLKPSPSPHWRRPAAAALAATGCIHIALVPAHLHEAPYAGALFIALSAAALALAILLVKSNHQLAWLGAAALSLTALLAYVISRSIGLPSVADDIGDWLTARIGSNTLRDGNGIDLPARAIARLAVLEPLRWHDRDEPNAH
jgi:hypothetical protein